MTPRQPFRDRRLLLGLLAAVLVLVVGTLVRLAGPSPRSSPLTEGDAVAATGSASAAAAAPATRGVVPPELFGMQVRSIGSAPPTNLRAGAVRLWDAKVSWRRVQPTPTTFTWDVLDAAVANAKAIGATEITYTVGVVPMWAASNLRPAIYGPGTAAHPTDDADYLRFVTAVAARYRGRISSYELWNEPNLKDFYNGTPQQLAELVGRAAAAIRAVDPAATIVAPSAVVGPAGPADRGFFRQFARELERRGWPVDAVSVHLYVPADRGPDTRARYLRASQRWFADRGWTGPMWDTETSYGDRREGAPIRRVYTGTTAATYVARTYIDSMRHGVPRVFWYGWEVDTFGIDLTVDGRRTPAGDAFLTISGWMAGARWHGCRTTGLVTTCAMTRDGRRSQILYASRRSEVPLPSGTRSWESLDGTTTVAAPGDEITVHDAPVLVRH